MSEEKDKKGMKKSTKVVLGLASAAALLATGYTVAKRYLQQNELDEDDYIDDEEVEFMSCYDELDDDDFSDYGEDEELMDAVEHISKPAINETPKPAKKKAENQAVSAKKPATKAQSKPKAKPRAKTQKSKKETKTTESQ